MNQETKKALLAGVFLFLAVMVANYYLFASKISGRIKRLKAEIEHIESRKQKALLLLKKVHTLMAQKRSLEKEIEKLKSLLPKDEDLPGLIRAIAQLAHTSGIDLSRVELGREVVYPEKHYAVVNIKVSFSSRYQQLMDFLSKVDSLNRLVKPYRLRVASKETSEDPSLKVSGTLQTYRYVENVKKRGKR